VLPLTLVLLPQLPQAARSRAMAGSTASAAVRGSLR
jgi:hypothetical protein